jgi:molybdopterin molybdotransferase
MRAARVHDIDVIPIQDAIERVLAKPVVARRYLPASDLAVVDGYAVCSVDLQHASPTNPRILQLVGESRLGEGCRARVREGQAVAVATGSTMPKGADAVVKIEHTRKLTEEKIEFRTSVGSWEGITRKGEDIAPGRVVLGMGSRLRPEDIGALKTLGITKVQVVRKLRVGVLSTGNELVDSPRKRDSSKVVDLNRPILSGMLRELGAKVVDLGIVRDEKHAIKAALRRGLAETDLVLVTAGSSVGKRDLVPDCINSLGRPGMLVHGVAMRPAMPTGLAVVEGKPVVSLPGFPVSAMLAFRVFVRPLLARLVGAPEPVDPTIRAVLKEKIRGMPGHRTFVRVRVSRGKDGYWAVPLKAQRSSLLTSMVDANGIVNVPESSPIIKAGVEVSVTLIGDAGS